MGNPTQKQKNFVREFLKSGNAAESYRKCYDVKKESSNWVYVEAFKLLSDPNITPYLQKLQDAVTERTLVTVESITEELEENREKARGLDQPAAMNVASMGKAKLHGLLIDKVDTDAKLTVIVRSDDADL